MDAATAMETIFWACLLGGLAFTVLALLVGDLLEGVLDAFDSLDGFIDPLSIIGGITAFGGAGLIIGTTTTLDQGATVALAAGVGIALAIGMHFLYVRPMKRGEVSTGFSIQEYRGRIGEVLTTIPARGYGEVMIHIGHANTSREAASFNGTEIASGTQIVVVEVRGRDLLVAPFEDEAATVDLLPEAPSISENVPTPRLGL